MSDAVAKQKAMRGWSDLGCVVRPVISPNTPAVVLPEHLRSEKTTLLDYAKQARIPIPNLDVGIGGVSATLSFNRSPTKTFVPWAAVVTMGPLEAPSPCRYSGTAKRHGTSCTHCDAPA